MSKKTKIFLVVEIIVVLLIIGGVVFYINYTPKEPVEHLTEEEKAQQAIDRANNQLIESNKRKNEAEKRYQDALNRAIEGNEALKQAEENAGMTSEELFNKMGIGPSQMTQEELRALMEE